MKASERRSCATRSTQRREVRATTPIRTQLRDAILYLARLEFADGGRRPLWAMVSFWSIVAAQLALIYASTQGVSWAWFWPLLLLPLFLVRDLSKPQESENSTAND
jgi:hypothetical protein